MKALLCLMLSLLLVACGGPRGGKPLAVGMDLSYPPFETIDEAGKPAGISVEMAEALGEFLGRPVVIENIPFVGLIPALQSGRVDVVISSMTDTPERRRSIDFSAPYLTIGLAMLVGKDSPVQSVTDVDQPGRVVVVRQGTTGEAWARRALAHAKILAVERESAAVLEVMQGGADAFVYDQMSIWKNWTEHPEKTRALLEPFQTEQWAIGVRKGNPELVDSVNAFIEAFRSSGGFQRLGEKYLREQMEEFRKRDLPFYF